MSIDAKNQPSDEIMKKSYKILEEAIKNSVDLLNKNGGEFADLTIFCFYNGQERYCLSRISDA
jgi:hypothetical protein